MFAQEILIWEFVTAAKTVSKQLSEGFMVEGPNWRIKEHFFFLFYSLLQGKQQELARLTSCWSLSYLVCICLAQSTLNMI